jgi:uncharacterized protein YabN with tetrapyrrole methylase and pyrophosphatase domain
MAAALARGTERWETIRRAVEGGETGELSGAFGDLLLAVADAARLSGVDPESALRESTGRFEERTQGGSLPSEGDSTPPPRLGE